MADVAALDRVRDLLDQASRDSAEGRRLIQAAIAATLDAYEALPVGVVLHMPDLPYCEAFRVRKDEDGWTSWTDGWPPLRQGDEWVRENWERGNLVILDDEEISRG